MVKKALANLGLPTPPVLDRGAGAFPLLGFPFDVPPILTLSATPSGPAVPFLQHWLKSKVVPYEDNDVGFYGSKGQKSKRVVVDCTGLVDIMQTSDLACDVIKVRETGSRFGRANDHYILTFNTWM